MTVVVKRRDEFDGEIAVSVEGLPAGVTCPGAVLGGDVKQAALVLVGGRRRRPLGRADQDRRQGKVGDREVVREARYADRRLGHAEPPAAAARVPPGAGRCSSA